ncbi:MAG: aminotransferase class V-fold PLP-dependent enzyme, partial [Planctomycetaceae bacterium]|nr:aminotransferase class V-fold PLP-dependent enzyme [Planctomycetaceae bacterium]
KHSIRQLVRAPDDWQVLLASRSLSLVQLALSCMFRVCRNVLATDLSWPTYEQAIEAKARLTGNHITTVPLRDAILSRGWTVDDVTHYLSNAFVAHQCDGLFLPAVDHLGIRLPVRKVVQQIREQSELRFCFLDAAQAFCHVPLDDCLEFADFIVGGSHKWMGAYLPTGIGLFGQRRSRGMLERRVSQPPKSEPIDDPLLHFTEQLDAGGLDGHSETANLTSLFACAGAVFHQIAARANIPAATELSIDRRVALVPRPSAEWHPRQPHPSFRSRIVLFETQLPGKRPACPEAIRRTWLDSGCIVTGYPDGRARVSLPR